MAEERDRYECLGCKEPFLVVYEAQPEEPSQEFLKLPPGGHDVEVRVAWDGTEKVERIWGDFRAGSTRRLQARISGLFKGLSLRWQ